MDIQNLKNGMIVTICKELKGSETERRFSLDDSDGYMIYMQGQNYPIRDISFSENKVKIYCPDANRTFVFDPVDLFPVDIDKYYGPPPEPVTFDETKLVL